MLASVQSAFVMITHMFELQECVISVRAYACMHTQHMPFLTQKLMWECPGNSTMRYQSPTFLTKYNMLSLAAFSPSPSHPHMSHFTSIPSPSHHMSPSSPLSTSHLNSSSHSHWSLTGLLLHRIKENPGTCGAT